MAKRIDFDLKDIRDQFRDEDISELVAMLVGSKITLSQDNKNYVFHMIRPAFCDGCGLHILAYEANKKDVTVSTRASPDSTDSLYDSCINLIKTFKKVEDIK